MEVVAEYKTIVEDTPEFIESNLKLVHKMCNKYRRWINSTPGIEYDDVFSIGCMGLIKAVRKFDPSFGVKFSTYAIPMIEGEIRRTKRDYGEHTLKVSRAIKVCYTFLCKHDMWDAPDEEIAKASGLKVDVVSDTKRYYSHHTFIDLEDRAPGVEGDKVTIQDTIGMDVDFDSRVVLEEFLATLTDKQRTVVDLSLKDYKQDDIGEIVGLSQVQVSRILRKVSSLAREYGGNDKGEGKSMKPAQGDMKEARRLIAETGLSADEIANMTGCNLQTIKTYIYKSRGPAKPSPAKNSKVTTRTLTEAEKIKYGIVEQQPVEQVTHGQITQINTELDQPSIQEQAQEAPIIQESIGAISAGLSVGLSVGSNGVVVDLQQIADEVGKALRALKSLGKTSATFELVLK